MALYTIGNQFIETTSYGKANLDKLEAYRLANNMQEFLTAQYRLTPTTIAQVYGSIADATQRETHSIYQHSGYRAIPTTPTDIPEMITDTITMLVIERFEKAIQIADGVYTRYKQAVIDTPMSLTGNTGQDIIYKAAYLHGVVKSIYNTYYASTDEDVSMYELVHPTTSGSSDSSDSSDTDEPNFSQLSVLFTTRMGPLHHNRVETLDAMLMQPMVERNNKSVAQYGAEYLTEMLQISLPFSFQTTNTARTDYVSPNTLSCGFFIMRDPDNPVQVLNIRAFATHVFNFQLHDTIYPIAISSGFDLKDLIDMEIFREGNTSTNLVTLLNNICLTLNGDTTGGFATTDTLWEFGPIADFDTLRCKSAPNIPHWTGKLIKDCIVYKGTIDVPARVRRQMEYMHATYSEFYNGQMILFPYTDTTASTGSTNEKIVTIIYVIKNGVGEISIQTKEARIDTIFPQEPIGTNTAISRELLVQNTKGDPILLVNPTEETMTVKGKLGVGIDIDTPNTTVDIDDTSIGDMTRFINKIAEKTKDVTAICNSIQNLNIDNDMVWFNTINHTINTFLIVANSAIATYYLGTYTVPAFNGTDAVHFVVFSSQSNDVKDTTSPVSMPENTFTETQWNALNNTTAGHVLLESMTIPTHTDIRNNAIASGDPTFIYELDMTSKNAKDTMIIHSAEHSTWIGHTLQNITDNVDPDQDITIQQAVLPPVQSILSDSLCYAGSVKSFVVTMQSESKYVTTGSVLFGKALTPRRQTIQEKMRNQIVALQKIAKTAEIDSITYLMTVHNIAEAPQGGAWNGGDTADLAAMGNVGVQRSGGSNIPVTDQEIWRHAFTYTLQRLLQMVLDMSLLAIDFWTHLQNINLTIERTRLEEDLQHIFDIGYVLDIQDNITTVQDNSVLSTLIGLHNSFDKIYVTPTLYIVGTETNLRDTATTNPINIRNTTYVQEWFRRIHAMDIRMNFVKYHHVKNVNTFGYGITHAEANIGTLISKYPELATNIYIYTFANEQTTLSSDSIATQAVVGTGHAPQETGSPSAISNVTDPVLKDMHTLFVTQYSATTVTSPVPTHTIGAFGARGHLHPHAYYFLFYQISTTQIFMFYVDMSTDFFAPSFRLAGDMNIRGQLTVQDGVWIGGKLLRANGDGLVWGDVVLGTTGA